MKLKTCLLFLTLAALLLPQCNNFIHELIPREDMPAILTVSFDKNGGTTDASPATKTVTPPAATVDALPDAEPTWAGHLFEGWWTENGDGGNWGAPFTASTPVTAEITVYAKWTANTYTVTFDRNGGTTNASPQTKTVTFPATTIDALPAPPARTGYIFGSWNTAADGSGAVFDASTPVTANITVCAQWLAGYTAIAAGYTHTIALGSDGKFRATGYNYYGQLGLGNNASPNVFTEMTGLNGKNITAIAAGNYHTIALGSDGKVWAAGWNYYGQLGLGDTADTNVFTEVTGLNGKNITAIATGRNHTMALGSDGKVRAAGHNSDGPLGLGNYADAYVFTEVPGL
jgi:uncharacterized repeat protein (TIGR02543 family)